MLLAHHGVVAAVDVVAAVSLHGPFLMLCTLQAFQVVTWAQKAAVAVMAVTALLAAAAVGAGSQSLPVWGGLSASAVVAALAVWQLGVMRQKFTFVDYVHAEH